MISASLDTILNLLWAGIGVCALAGLTSLELRSQRRSRRCWRMQRLCAVLVATVCLFPSVSYSDDLIGLSMLQSGLSSRGGVGAPDEESGPGPSLSLAGQLQTLEHCQIEGSHSGWVSFGWVGVVSGNTGSGPTREVHCASGRAPPAA